MKRDHIIHAVAGLMILSGLLLAVTVDLRWLWLDAFVGLNLFQSAFSGWCLLRDILDRYQIGT